MLFHIRLFRANKLSQVIDLADEYVFHGDLEKIIEVTYSYRKTEEGFLINETLFEEYLGKLHKGKDIPNLGRSYKYKVGIQLVLIDDIIKKTRKLKMCARSGKLCRDIFIEALEYIKIILDISIEAIEFEMEKAGYFQKMTKKKIERKIKKIEKGEKESFGEKILDNQDDYSLGYQFVVEKYEKNKSKLSSGDDTEMKRFIQIFRSSVPYEIIEIKTQRNKNISGEFLKKKIPRRDYRLIFDAVCDFYNLPQRTKLTSAGSIYDGDKYLEIPRDKNYAYFTVKRLLALLTHEIESHYINAHNGRLLLGNFRGAKNLPKEEGLATFMEKIFIGHTYDDIVDVSPKLLNIFAGEILAGKDYENFMRILNAISGTNKDYINAIIRSKRNYSFSHVGVQHKDVVYFRGLNEIIKYLKSGGEFRKLFLGKVGFHDLEHLSDIHDLYENKSELIFPIFISDLIYYYLKNKQQDSSFIFVSQDYYMKLKKKYWFLDFDSFKIIEQIEIKWKKIDKIFKIFERILDSENH